MQKILIVEDETAIADLIAMHLSIAGYQSAHVDNGTQVWEAIQREQPDLVLLDVMLPGQDGFSVMERIQSLPVPVIFLTARDDLMDKVKGLKLGADDYIAKPFHALELLGRIEAVLRRTAVQSEIAHIGEVTLHVEEHLVCRDGLPVELTAKEFLLLETLWKNRNIALSRDRLIELVWGYDFMGDTRTVDVHIQRLRSKLGLAAQIRTIHRIGYRLEVPR